MLEGDDQLNNWAGVDGRVGVRCPSCQKLFRTSRQLLQKPPIRFECLDCGGSFGVVAPVSNFDLVASSFLIDKEKKQNDLEEQEPMAVPVSSSSKQESEPFAGFDIKWSSILANFDEKDLKEDFFKQGWATQTLHEVAGKFARLAEVLPTEKTLQGYIRKCQACAEVAILNRVKTTPMWTMQRPLLLLLCFLLGFNFVFGLFMREYRWLFAISLIPASVLWLIQRSQSAR